MNVNVNVSLLNQWYEENKEDILADYFTLLRFKTISSDPDYKEEMNDCANWLKCYLNQIGMEATLWETSGHPVVFGQNLKAGPDKPTILIYHHYDVQPVDPLALWVNDPFNPTIKEGSVFARGALDNKGQCAYSLAAIKAFLKLTDERKFNIKVFIEGEEESGGKGTFEILSNKENELQADHLLIIDMDLKDATTPAITLGMRGILTLEVECSNSSTDLHSGTHGGIALNPNRALVSALAKLWDSNGSIAIPEFYNDVAPLSKEDACKLDLTFNKDDYTEKFGIKAFSKERGFTLLESNWLRPCLEINGIWGGYTGSGFKTVIPAKAQAKLSCRLVPDQDPNQVGEKIKNFLEEQMPEGITLKVEYKGAKAFRSSFNSSLILTVAKAYEEVFTEKCSYVLCGASVPIVPLLASTCGGETALIGCGLPEDNIHAPNEHFGLERFKKGFLTVGRILALLGE